MNKEVIYNYIYNQLKNKKVSLTSSVSIIALIVEEVEKINNLNGDQKKQYVVEIIKMIVSGEDGKLNTADDLIPPAISSVLFAVIENEAIYIIIDSLIYSTNNKLNVNKSSNCCSFI